MAISAFRKTVRQCGIDTSEEGLSINALKVIVAIKSRFKLASAVSYLLVTAATMILLRCAIECGILDTKTVCVRKLVELRDSLRAVRDDSDWDLADF
jgi:hypothetical protein